MNYQSQPIKLNQELSDLRDITKQIIEIFSEAYLKEHERYNSFLEEQIEALQKALDDSATPEEYKVAIVGSFKVGKSSFVNALCGMKNIASVNTNPETAAITIFRYASEPRAEIYMTEKEEWDEMRDLYHNEPDNLEAERYRNIYKLEESNKLKEEYSLSLVELEEQYISSPCFVERLDCADWNNTKARNEFSKKLKKYVSRRNPLHYLVDHLEVYVPVSLLADGIYLIDTPGLDDTDRYRVSLTEKLVENVDVILFLTQSGSSYSQANKEFIISQLRKQTIKHLRIIVTKIDETFNNARRDAKDNDEEPSTFKEHLEIEENRLKGQLQLTLDEMLNNSRLNDDEDAKRYYIEQLNNIKISFVSSHYYSDGNIEDSGIIKLQNDLNVMLAESERILKAKRTLSQAIERSYERVLRVFKSRLEATNQEFDSERIHKQLKKISLGINEKFSSFKIQIDKQVQLLEKNITGSRELVESRIALILLEAKSLIIEEFQAGDIESHWARRRVGKWGYINDLQTKVADRIFPHLELILQTYNHFFKVMLIQVKECLQKLQEEVVNIESEYTKNTSLENMNLTKILNWQHNLITNNIEHNIRYFKININRKLGDFLSEEFEAKLEEAKQKVTKIKGVGTNNKQKEEIKNFYSLLKNALSEELEKYVRERLDSFSAMLKDNSQNIYPIVKECINTVITDRLKAIENNLAALNEHQKAELIKYLTNFIEEIEKVNHNLPNIPQATF